jgi:hypothetical protein
LLQQLLVIIRRGDVPLQQHVRMRIDQSRQARLARQINQFRARRSVAGDFFDLLSLNHHHNILPQRIPAPIEQTPAAQGNGFARTLSLRSQTHEEENEAASKTPHNPPISPDPWFRA